jgi:hypothetical protein
MSATEIMKELPHLTEAERRLLLDKLQEIVNEEDAGPSEHLAEKTGVYRAVDLRARGIGEAQAADLSARLKTFADDWSRPEASIYDEDPAR